MILLGGKMAFCTGCVDPRIKAVASSDFGFLNHATGYRPPRHALDAAYDFLEKYLR